MTTGYALPCPRCKRVLDAASWRDATGGACWSCRTDFDFFSFPALTAKRARVAPQAAAVAEDSACFFHAENRAEAVCEDCGRMLCAVCTISFTGRKICPACIAAAKTSDAAPAVQQRVLYDAIALSLAVLPLLLWPFTLVTAPVALGYVIVGWKKPGSLVRGNSRTRLVIAGVFALLEIAGWVTLGVYLVLKKT